MSNLKTHDHSSNKIIYKKITHNVNFLKFAKNFDVNKNSFEIPSFFAKQNSEKSFINNKKEFINSNPKEILKELQEKKSNIGINKINNKVSLKKKIYNENLENINKNPSTSILRLDTPFMNENNSNSIKIKNNSHSNFFSSKKIIFLKKNLKNNSDGKNTSKKVNLNKEENIIKFYNADLSEDIRNENQEHSNNLSFINTQNSNNIIPLKLKSRHFKLENFDDSNLFEKNLKKKFLNNNILYKERVESFIHNNKSMDEFIGNTIIKPIDNHIKYKKILNEKKNFEKLKNQKSILEKSKKSKDLKDSQQKEMEYFIKKLNVTNKKNLNLEDLKNLNEKKNFQFNKTYMIDFNKFYKTKRFNEKLYKDFKENIFLTRINSTADKINFRKSACSSKNIKSLCYSASETQIFPNKKSRNLSAVSDVQNNNKDYFSSFNKENKNVSILKDAFTDTKQKFFDWKNLENFNINNSQNNSLEKIDSNLKKEILMDGLKNKNLKRNCSFNLLVNKNNEIIEKNYLISKTGIKSKHKLKNIISNLQLNLQEKENFVCSGKYSEKTNKIFTKNIMNEKKIKEKNLNNNIKFNNKFINTKLSQDVKINISIYNNEDDLSVLNNFSNTFIGVHENISNLNKIKEKKKIMMKKNDDNFLITRQGLKSDKSFVKIEKDFISKEFILDKSYSTQSSRIIKQIKLKKKFNYNIDNNVIGNKDKINNDYFWK